MANENKNIKELVSDDDNTAELEIITCRQFAAHKESDAHTVDTGEHDSPESQDARQLRFDLEQLQAKSRGLDAEIRVRTEINETMSAQIDSLHETLQRKWQLATKRAGTIRALLDQLRSDRERHRHVLAQLDDVERRCALLQQQLETAESTLLAAPADASPDEPSVQKQVRTEEYADVLRRKLQDTLCQLEYVEEECRTLGFALDNANEQNRRLAADASSAARRQKQLEDDLARQLAQHEEELRLLRFELGEAQQTMSQTEELNSQLASDLVDSRGFKEELERMLCHNDEQARDEIDRLEAKLAQSSREAGQLQRQLTEKNEAVNVLLGELARKNEQLDAFVEVDEFIDEVDAKITASIKPELEPAPIERDRTTRLLVGKIGQQTLRFPLFKKQLTIGRNPDNDIQLNAVHVSRRHAVVLREAGVTRIIDWGSKNGVFVNAKRVTEHFLRNGDILRIGSAKFRYEERAKRDS